MTRRNFTKITVKDYDLTRVQTNIGAAFSDLAAAPELNAHYITLDVIPATDIIVNHGLNREPLEYIIVRKSAAVEVWDSSTPNRDPERKLILQASSTATITLKVL